ncbi:hypothetical protein ACF0H5_000001 [Mactra antiquata]
MYSSTTTEYEEDEEDQTDGLFVIDNDTGSGESSRDESEEEDEEESLFLIDTATENSISFAESWKKNNSFHKFLHRDDHIAVRPTALKMGIDQEELLHTSDIDGVTIEWLNIATGLKSEFRHFELLPLGVRSLRRVYPVIKKHLNLRCYKDNSLAVLKDCVGTQIVYDGSFETWLGFIPNPNESRTIYDFPVLSRLAYTYLERLKSRFQDGLKDMLRKGIALDTLAKNNLNDAKRLFVLPGHQIHVLDTFQRALEETELIGLPGFQKMLFTFRFGEKCETPVDLPVKDANSVKDICVHVGHRISSDFVDVFWSRAGVESVSSGGANCVITSACSFFECANLQSPLTNRRWQISNDLKAVSTCPENIRFVQLYSDLPHRYPKSRVHPVSASVIMLEGLFTAVGQKSLYSDALTYLSEIQNNFFQMDRGVCRLEFVISIGQRSSSVTGAEFVRLERLGELLEKHPLIVPFLRQACTLKLCRVVGLSLHKFLESAFRSGRGTGNTRLTWEVYQIELALEKLLWGRPLCSLSNQYSKNLGPGIQYPTRCLTDQRGFLCLDNSGSCCVDERTLPPVSIFTKNQGIQRKLQSISGLYTLIGGSNLALGRRLLDIILRDFHTSGKLFTCYDNYFRLLKANGRTKPKIVGGITVADLVKRLCTAKNFKCTYVFGEVRTLLHKMKVNVEDVIEQGINGMKLSYFPAFRNYDDHRNVGLYWEFSCGFWVVTDVSDQDSELERDCALMQNLVLTELETRKLCHSSKWSGVVFPWMKSSLEKIKEKSLPVNDKVKVLAFISCVAFIQDGQYVHFYSLRQLVNDLPVPQSTLRQLEIQSPFLIPGVNNVKIYSLHSSIPLKCEAIKTEIKDTPRTVERIKDPVMSLQDDTHHHVEPDDNVLVVPEVTDVQDLHSHVPSDQCYSKWSPIELAIVGNLSVDSQLNIASKYQQYKTACRDLHIPDRSYDSFRRKLLRLQKRT